MTTTERTYRLSASGARARGSERSVPTWYRAILGLFQGEMAAGEIVAGMGASSGREVLKWIDELETLGFVDLVVPASSEPAAEATTDFGFDVVLARMRAA